MRFVKHTLISLLVLILIWGVPYTLISIEILRLGYVLFGMVAPLPVIVHFCYIFCYCKKRCNLFALSLSHVVFPALLFVVLFFLIEIALGLPYPAGWNYVFVVVAGMYYFMPIALVILLIAISRKVVKK